MDTSTSLWICSLIYFYIIFYIIVDSFMQVTFSFEWFSFFLLLMMTHPEVGMWNTFFTSNIRWIFGKPSNDIFMFVGFFFQTEFLWSLKMKQRKVWWRVKRLRRYLFFFNEHLFVQSPCSGTEDFCMWINLQLNEIRSIWRNGSVHLPHNWNFCISDQKYLSMYYNVLL